MTCEAPEKMRAKSEKNGYKNGTSIGSLHSQVVHKPLWPTPNTRGYRSDGELKMLSRATVDHTEYRDMSNQAASSKRERFWPTPQSCSAMAAGNIQNRVNDKFPNLESVVARSMWPTPTATCHKGARTREAQKKTGRGWSNTLSDAMRIATNGESGSLNPTWVEWLMGFPEGWTDLED
jgi:hypothetical protein|tara:strand:- start:126 stop:659 length:534 start_codon:yes stop_codon:yes gene_type:complete